MEPMFTSVEDFDSNSFVRYIHQKYHHTLYFFAVSLCKRFKFDVSYADDLMQEFYHNVLAKGQQVYDGYQSHGLNSLMRILHYDIHDMERKRKSIARVQEVFAHAIDSKVDVNYFAYQICSEKFMQYMEQALNPQEQAVMKLFVEGYKHREIADLLNMNINTVSGNVRRAKKKLKDFLDD